MNSSVVLRLNENNINETADAAADVIIGGGVAIIPTDTIYGFVCDAANPHALERIYSIKGRERDKPFLVLLPSLRDATRYTDMALPDVVRRHTPGALTFIVPLKDGLTLPFTNDTLAMRIPDTPFLRALLSRTPPVVAPSANRAGVAPSMKIAEIIGEFTDEVDCIVDAGDCAGGQASTIYDCMSGKVIRQGAVHIE